MISQQTLSFVAILYGDRCLTNSVLSLKPGSNQASEKSPKEQREDKPVLSLIEGTGWTKLRSNASVRNIRIVKHRSSAEGGGLVMVERQVGGGSDHHDSNVLIKNKDLTHKLTTRHRARTPAQRPRGPRCEDQAREGLGQAPRYANPCARTLHVVLSAQPGFVNDARHKHREACESCAGIGFCVYAPHP